jgi:dTDP-glucose pyrophosphorylase
VNILILAAGPDQSTPDGGYPLCLTEYNSVPLIQYVLTTADRLGPRNVIAMFREQDRSKYHLDSVVSLVAKNSTILAIREPTQGAACTALLAIKHIDNDEELLILNGNELLDTDFRPIVAAFRDRQLDAGVVVFQSVHPRYSYVRLDDRGFVIEASEKNPISNHATVGFYWFRRGADFVRAAKSLIRKDAHVNGHFYICPTFNELILASKSIGVFPVSSKAYHPLKDERQLKQFDQAATQRTKDEA